MEKLGVKYLILALPLWLLAACSNSAYDENFNQGKTALESKQYEQAADYFYKAMQEKEKDHEVKVYYETAQSMEKAEVALKEGSYDEVIRLTNIVKTANLDQSVVEESDLLKEKATGLKKEMADITARIREAKELIEQERLLDAQSSLQSIVNSIKDKEELNAQYKEASLLLIELNEEITSRDTQESLEQKGSDDTSDIKKPSSNPGEETVNSAQTESFTYHTYTNTRYGFTVEYPTTFTQGEAPTNNDGRNFYNGEANITASGSHINVIEDNETIETYYNQALEYITGNISYQRLGSDWYVISYTDGSNIVYEKSIIGTDIISNLVISYPSNKQDYYGPMVTRISGTFEGGETGLSW